jgi:Zinc dependent phospholipase C
VSGEATPCELETLAFDASTGVASVATLYRNDIITTMGTWISHLRIAENLLHDFPDIDEVTFAFGNLSPDSGVPNADWTAFDPPKEVTHFLKQGEGEHAIHDLVYYRQYLAPVKPEENINLYSFRLGYFFHLICDIMWAKRIWQATKFVYRDELERNETEAVGNIKRDWYGLDQVYVRKNPDSLFWRVIVPRQNPPSYLPFVKDEALHHQYNYIRKYYSQPESDWFSSLPFHYLNEKTMSRVIRDSIEAVLIVYKKLQNTKDLDDVPSSIYLLPETLITPYKEPLGN